MHDIIAVAVIGGILALVLIASTLPWIEVNFQGRFPFTLFDVLRSYIDRSATSPMDFQRGDFSSLVQDLNTFVAFYASLVFYTISIVFLGIAVPNTRHRNTFLTPGAAFAIVAGASCIYGVETMKLQIIEDGRTGGPYAPLANGFISSVIFNGAGPLVVIACGIAAVVFSFVKDLPARRDMREKTEDELTNHEEKILERPPESIKTVILNEPDSRKPLIDTPPNINRIVYKSSGTAALIAFIGAIFGLPGIGHIYVGRIGRGLLILFSGLFLYILSWLTFLGGLFGGAIGRSVPVMQAGVGLGIVLILMYFGLLIWQVFNARSLAKKFNEQIQQTGIEPW